MLPDVPLYINALFILITLAVLWFFYRAMQESESAKTKIKIVIGLFSVWLLLQALLASIGFYNTDKQSTPPHFLLAIAPPMLFILILFTTQSGRNFIDGLSLKWITYMHIVRVFVELVLFMLCIYKYIPQLMTFEGRNFDILAGATAPLIGYYGFIKGTLSKRTILIWNIAALCLLLNIVINAVLSAPFAFQQFAFDQPNVAILYFPYIWLPAFIVPVILFGHLVAIRRLTQKIKAV